MKHACNYSPINPISQYKTTMYTLQLPDCHCDGDALWKQSYYHTPKSPEAICLCNYHQTDSIFGKDEYLYIDVISNPNYTIVDAVNFEAANSFASDLFRRIRWSIQIIQYPNWMQLNLAGSIHLVTH